MVERRSGVSPEEFFREYVTKNRPVILTDVLSGWRALDKWTPEFFRERYGERTIDFMRDPVKQMQMGEFITQVLASRPGNPAPYWTNNPISQIFPELLEDLKPFPKHTGPNWAARKYLHKGMQQSLNRGAEIELYIGGAGAPPPDVPSTYTPPPPYLCGPTPPCPASTTSPPSSSRSGSEPSPSLG